MQMKAYAYCNAEYDEIIILLCYDDVDLVIDNEVVILFDDDVDTTSINDSTSCNEEEVELIFDDDTTVNNSVVLMIDDTVVINFHADVSLSNDNATDIVLNTWHLQRNR